MSACNQILGKTFGPKTMAPTEMKIFRFSRKMEDEKQKIILFIFGRVILRGFSMDFPRLFAFFGGMLEFKNCLV